MRYLYTGAGLVAALLLFIPILALVQLAILDTDQDGSFAQLLDTVLWDYVANSFSLVALTLGFACLFAIAPAWWCARYEFAGRKYLQWAMVLPLAVPAYISAYIYTDALDYAGPIQRALRHAFDWQSPQDYWFFDIRSKTGAAIMLALALYPYIYLLLRQTFAQQSDQLEQAARLLGASPRQIFFQIRLKLARPALAIGCTLVAMETLADYGTVSLFAVSTLTTAIYDAWLVYGSLATAAKVACLLLLVVVSLVGLERWQRREQKHFDLKGHHRSTPVQAKGYRLILIWTVCLCVITLGFIIPVFHLVAYCWDYWQQNLSGNLWDSAQHTFLLAAGAAIICLVLALLFNSGQRFALLPRQKFLSNALQSIASLGYAVPGTVLAIAVLIPLGAMDLKINQLWQSLNWPALGLIFSGTGFALLLAFIMRFAAISNGSLHSQYHHLSPNMDLAARTMKRNDLAIFKSLHLPLLTPAMISALLLVFIECVKELPAALLLRPFDFDTLSTFTYQFASDEQLEHGALAALLIIGVSLIPIALLSRTQKMA